MALSPTSSHGSTVIAREQFNPASFTSVSAGQVTNLPWSSASGDVLLDTTTATNPTVIDAGVYAVSVAVAADAAYAGQFCTLVLDLDRLGEDALVETITPLSGAGGIFLAGSLALTYYVPAGGEIRLQAKHSNASAVGLISFGIVQRLS